MITHNLPVDPSNTYVVERHDGSTFLIHTAGGMAAAACIYAKAHLGRPAKLSLTSYTEPHIHLIGAVGPQRFAVWRRADFRMLEERKRKARSRRTSRLIEDQFVDTAFRVVEPFIS